MVAGTAADTGVIETWIVATPAGTANVPARAMSWACGGFSVVAAVIWGLWPFDTGRSAA